MRIWEQCGSAVWFAATLCTWIEFFLVFLNKKKTFPVENNLNCWVKNVAKLNFFQLSLMWIKCGYVRDLYFPSYRKLLKL